MIKLSLSLFEIFFFEIPGSPYKLIADPCCIPIGHLKQSKNVHNLLEAINNSKTWVPTIIY